MEEKGETDFYIQTDINLGNPSWFGWLYHRSNACHSCLVREDSLFPENNHIVYLHEGKQHMALWTRIPSSSALRLTPVITSGMSDNPVSLVSLLSSGNAVNSKGITTTCDVRAPLSIIVRIYDSPDSEGNDPISTV